MERQDINILLPLMNSAFRPGECYKTLQEIEDSVEHDFGSAEYYYFTGHPEETVVIMEPYLKSKDIYQRLTACFLYAYASLSVDNLENSYDVLAGFEEDFKKMQESDDTTEPLKTFGTLVYGAAGILLYLQGGYCRVRRA